MTTFFSQDRLKAELADLSFSLLPALRDIPAGTLALGLGDADSPGIALNCKNSLRHRSVSAWLWHLDAAERQALRQRAQQQPVRHVAIEDFSLDSIFAWLQYVVLIADGVFPDGLAAWVEYVDGWEQGSYLDGDDVGHSAACLHTVHAHALLNAASVEGANYHPQRLRDGFIRCVTLLADFVNQTAAPLDGIRPVASAEYQAASAALAYEQQLYELTIQRAVTCQLLAEQVSSGRKVLIDALFLNEQEPSGLFKIFARNDRRRSWSKNGFTLLGIHRPQEQGSGNDVVISVDPRSSVTLQSLWRALEEAENARWYGQRPADRPRPLHSYRDGEGMLPRAPNQPWWDDSGHYTLLAAPKRLESGELGSKLDWWQDVLPLIWQQGFVQPLIAGLTRVETPVSAPGGQKRVCAWRWAQADAQQALTDTNRYLVETPAFQAWLAGCSQPEPPRSPWTLPQTDQFEAAWLGGVMAVCHQQGVTLFSREANSQTLDGLLAVTQRIATLSDDYSKFLLQIRHIFKKWPTRLKQHAAAIEDKQWEEEIFELRINALNVLNSTETLFASPHENRLSETLQRQWGLHDQRGTLFAQLDRLDQLMQDAITRQKSRRHRIYGSLFSALGMGIAASHVWEPVRDILTTNEYEWQLLLFKEPEVSTQHLADIAGQSAHFELITLIVFVAFALLGFVLFWFFDIRSQED